MRDLQLYWLQRLHTQEVSRYGYGHGDDENYFFPLAVIRGPLEGIGGNIPNIWAYERCFFCMGTSQGDI